MARSDWAALLTEPAAEYLAQTELQRFGLESYLPQLRKRHLTQDGATTMRSYPLFPRYLLIPIGYARSPTLRLARGICRHRPVLADDDGRPWRAPERVVDAIRQAEQKGEFDQILHKGDSVKLAYGVLSTVCSVLNSDAMNGHTLDLLMPLFGGAKATVNAAKVVRA